MKFVELVPRELDAFLDESEKVVKTFPSVNGINIPDLIRKPIRSYEAAKELLKKGIEPLPHIRTIDNPLEKSIDIVRELVDLGLKSVLIISGDLPENTSQEIHEVTPLMLTSKLRKEFKDLNIYCALDPYRQSFRKEFMYCQAKLDAGASGFFTQPLFDPNLAELYLHLFPHTKMFIGISPVITKQSKRYWKIKNNVVFPNDFELNIEYNCKLAKEIIKSVDSYNQHIYIMPISVPAMEYLTGVF